MQTSMVEMKQPALFSLISGDCAHALMYQSQLRRILSRDLEDNGVDGICFQGYSHFPAQGYIGTLQGKEQNVSAWNFNKQVEKAGLQLGFLNLITDFLAFLLHLHFLQSSDFFLDLKTCFLIYFLSGCMQQSYVFLKLLLFVMNRNYWNNLERC